MKKTHKFALLLAALLSTGTLALQAAPVSGSIGFSGTVSLDTNSASTATEVTGFHFAGTSGSPYVSSADGDFSSTLTDSVTFSAPWMFNSGPLANFWSVDGFTFDLLSSSISSQGVGSNGLGYVVVNGVGNISGNGFDSTPGTFSFSTNDPSAGGAFSFSGGTGTAVPEPSTAALIVAGVFLVGGLAFRARLRKV